MGNVIWCHSCFLFFVLEYLYPTVLLHFLLTNCENLSFMCELRYVFYGSCFSNVAMGHSSKWYLLLFFIPLLLLLLYSLLLVTETGFYMLFLSASSLPSPLVSFAFRWLLFRLMFGFGKLKFMGSTSKDQYVRNTSLSPAVLQMKLTIHLHISLYLREFFTAQPIPSKSGFYIQKLPQIVHKLALIFFFVVEIPIPFTFLYPLDWPCGEYPVVTK